MRLRRYRKRRNIIRRRESDAREMEIPIANWAPFEALLFDDGSAVLKGAESDLGLKAVAARRPCVLFDIFASW